MMRLAIVLSAIVAACGTASGNSLEGAATATSSTDSATSSPAVQLFPDVIDAGAAQGADGTWRIDATISSPYDSQERYADAFRILGPQGEQYGVRVLAHPHQNEQPFTRSLSGVEIPDGVDSVVVEGRDLVNGWGGSTYEINLER